MNTHYYIIYNQETQRKHARHFAKYGGKPSEEMFLPTRIGASYTDIAFEVYLHQSSEYIFISR